MASATQHTGAIAIIDSGLGGISVVRALLATDPRMQLIYAADTAGFPYGGQSADAVTARGMGMVEALWQQHRISRVVVACNTLSTLSLAALRAQFPQITFVGTVPAVKVAAEQSKTRRFTLLATPNTAHSPYSKSLIDQFAGGCVVDSVGAPNLASLCEQHLLGRKISDAAWRAEIEPCFHDDARGKTDSIILGCTHYPLVTSILKKLSPWDVSWIDSGDAIARQALRNYSGSGIRGAYVTNGDDCAIYSELFQREGLGACQPLPLSVAPVREAANG